VKRTLAHSVLFLAVAYALAADRAGAQNPTELPSVDAAKQEYRAALHRGLDFLARQSSQQAAAGGQTIDGETLREKLRPLVEESFDARQRLQQAEVKELRRQLAEIEQAIQEREKNREVIVNSRIDDLVTGRATSVKSQEPQSAPLPGSPSGAVATLPKNAPPGTEVRVRYVHEQQNVDGEIKTVTRPIYEFVNKQQPNAPQYVEGDSSVAPPRKSDDKSTSERKSATSDEGAMDLETRERLAQIDVEAAEEGLAAAKRNFDYSRAAFDTGTMPLNRFNESEKEYRQAEYELKRAKVKLEGLASQRAELEAAAAADVAEAEEEVKRATSQVSIADANAAAARGQLEQSAAEVEKVESTLALRTKVYDRLKNLAVQKAIDVKLLDEEEEKKNSAEASLRSAKGALATGKAEVEQTEAAIQEARARLHITEMRLRAAEARRARLLQRRAPDQRPLRDTKPDQSQPESQMSQRRTPGVPILADMPFLGRLFQSTTSVR
jgi:multidrug resistance efflux pump